MMNLSQKLYTPNIDELYIGCLCFIQNDNGEFIQTTLVSLMDLDKEIKMKCLDNNDILQLGFKLYRENLTEKISTFKKPSNIGNKPGMIELMISEIGSVFHISIFFEEILLVNEIEIKNKNELMFLLNRLRLM